MEQGFNGTRVLWSEKIFTDPPSPLQNGVFPDAAVTGRGIQSLTVRCQQMTMVDKSFLEKAWLSGDEPACERSFLKRARAFVVSLQSSFSHRRLSYRVVVFHTIGCFNEVVAQSGIRLTHQRRIFRCEMTRLALSPSKSGVPRQLRIGGKAFAEIDALSISAMSPISAKMPAA